MNLKLKKSWLQKRLVFFAILFVITIVCIVFFIPHTTRENCRCGRSTWYLSNLKQIGLSLKQYAMDYDDFFPPEDNAKGLDKLRVTDYLTDYGVYAGSRTTAIAQRGPLGEANCAYVYLGGFKENDNPNIPLAFNKPGDHPEILTVVFLDGHTQRYSTSATKSCEDIIIFLNKEHKYSEELFKKLLKKAKKIDSTLPKK